MRSSHRLGTALLAGAVLASGVSAPAQDEGRARSGEPVSTPVAEQGVAPRVEDPLPFIYVIAPGDVLRITVWKEPSLSTEASVRLDGKITVPLMGDVVAEGRTPDELTVLIRTGLMRFVEVPQVTVSVTNALSARFYVVGEVTVSSAFPLTGRITVLQALATAGGFREFANRERIVIIREHRGIKQAIPFNFSEIERGVNLQQNVVLKPGDTVVVP